MAEWSRVLPPQRLESLGWEEIACGLSSIVVLFLWYSGFPQLQLESPTSLSLRVWEYACRSVGCNIATLACKIVVVPTCATMVLVLRIPHATNVGKER